MINNFSHYMAVSTVLGRSRTPQALGDCMLPVASCHQQGMAIGGDAQLSGSAAARLPASGKML